MMRALHRALLAFVLVCGPASAHAQVISHVQTISGDQVLSTFGTGSGATVGSFGSNITGGNHIVVAVGGWHASNFTVATVTDTRGNTYTRIAQQSAASGGANCSIWLATGSSAGADTITVTPTQGADNYFAWSATELTKSGGAGAIDEDTAAEVGGEGDTLATDADTGTGASTTVADAWAVACLVVATGDSGQNITTAETGYTRRGVSQDSANVMGFEMADKALTSVGGQSALWDHDNSSGEWAAVVAVVKAAAAAPSGTSQPGILMLNVGADQ